MSTAKSKSGKKTKTTASRAKTDGPATTERGSKEDRGGHRIPIQLLVDYKSDGHFLFDFCRDLGTGGVFIETRQPLASGSMVDLTFTIPDSKETLETRGRVIWVQSEIPGKDLTPGMGVQFESFDSNQRRVLEDFIRRYNETASRSA